MKVTVNREHTRDLQPGEPIEKNFDTLSGPGDSLFLYQPGRGEVRVFGPDRRGWFVVESELVQDGSVASGILRKAARQEALDLLRGFLAGEASLPGRFGRRKRRADGRDIAFGLVLLLLGWLFWDKEAAFAAGAAFIICGCLLLYGAWKNRGGDIEMLRARLNVLDNMVQIQDEFHHLKTTLYARDEDGASLEILEQPGLSFDIHVVLQNGDELHLQTGFHWGSRFPTTDPAVIPEFMQMLRGILTGDCYFIKSKDRWEYAELVTPGDSKWKSAGVAASADIIRNDAAKRVDNA